MKFSDVQILINNAGVVSGKRVQDVSDAAIERTMQVNTISHMYLIKEFLPSMIARKRGHIVTIASLAGIAASPLMMDYNASKWGAVGMDEALRLELKKEGHFRYIKTTCICPYLIDTGMFKGAGSVLGFFML